MQRTKHRNLQKHELHWKVVSKEIKFFIFFLLALLRLTTLYMSYSPVTHMQVWIIWRKTVAVWNIRWYACELFICWYECKLFICWYECELFICWYKCELMVLISLLYGMWLSLYPCCYWRQTWQAGVTDALL